MRCALLRCGGKGACANDSTEIHRLYSGSFPHPLRGGLIPQLSHNTPRLQGERKEREEGEGGGKGRGEEKGRDPQGLVDTPHVSNPEKYPDFTRSRAAQRSTAQHTCERTLTHWDGY